MGQAKNKLNQQLPDIPKDILDRTSIAIRKLFTAASGHFGGDCYTHAAIGAKLLESAGYKAQIVSGEAAWRVSEGDSDVIVHALLPGMVPQPNAFPFHTWLEYGHKIIDFQTYQMHEKAEQLDALDGGQTKVDWCPDYLYVDRKSSSSLREATQGSTGLYHYRFDTVINNKINDNARAKPLDEDDLAHAMMIFANPDIAVLGPRNMRP